MEVDKTGAKGLSIQSAVTVLGGITGIIVAILWLGGRFYMAGYFSAMNIPPFQISYSIWEYSEASWSRLIFYFLAIIYPPLFMGVTTFLVILIAIVMAQRILPKLLIERAVDIIAGQVRAAWSNLRFLIVSFVGLYFLYLLLGAFVEIKNSGYRDGQTTIFGRSQAVEILSKETLPMDDGQVLLGTTPGAIQYRGLRLLTYNNGKYYLFRDIDPVTCKPAQVYVIESSPNIHIILSDFVPIDTPCAEKDVSSAQFDPSLP